MVQRPAAQATDRPGGKLQEPHVAAVNLELGVHRPFPQSDGGDHAFERVHEPVDDLGRDTGRAHEQRLGEGRTLRRVGLVEHGEHVHPAGPQQSLDRDLDTGYERLDQQRRTGAHDAADHVHRGRQFGGGVHPDHALTRRSIERLHDRRIDGPRRRRVGLDEREARLLHPCRFGASSLPQLVARRHQRIGGVRRPTEQTRHRGSDGDGRAVGPDDTVDLADDLDQPGRGRFRILERDAHGRAGNRRVGVGGDDDLAPHRSGGGEEVSRPVRTRGRHQQQPHAPVCHRGTRPPTPVRHGDHSHVRSTATSP